MVRISTGNLIYVKVSPFSSQSIRCFDHFLSYGSKQKISAPRALKIQAYFHLIIISYIYIIQLIVWYTMLKNEFTRTALYYNQQEQLRKVNFNSTPPQNLRSSHCCTHMSINNIFLRGIRYVTININVWIKIILLKI